MRLKIDYAITREEFEKLCLDDTRQKLQLHRWDTLQGRRRFFTGEGMGLNCEFEIVFARLEEKTGKDTNPVKKLRKLRADYLAGCREIWERHYHALRAGVLPFSKFRDVQAQVLDKRYRIYTIDRAFELFAKIRSEKPQKIETDALPFFTAAFDGNFTMFYAIYEGNNMSWNRIGTHSKNPFIRSVYKSMKKK